MQEEQTGLPQVAEPQDAAMPSTGEPPAEGIVYTPADGIQLTATQERALRELAAGQNISGAARLAGVDRRTVYRWMRADPNFASAYNAWKNEIVASGRARVLALTDLAIDTVKSAMLQGNARVAVQVAKATGAMQTPRPAPTNPEHLRRRQEVRDARRTLAIKAAEQQLRKDSGEDNPYAPPKNISTYAGMIDYLLQEYYQMLLKETPEARRQRMNSYQSDARTMCLIEPPLATLPYRFDSAHGPDIQLPYDFGPPVPGSPSATEQHFDGEGI
jgi:hypothetical protein